jgi:hypothetical protein
LLLVTHRPKGCIRFTPPLTIEITELHQILEALDKTHAALAPQNELGGHPHDDLPADKQPPVDNEHVAPGAEQFTPEVIAANKGKAKKGKKARA